MDTTALKNFAQEARRQLLGQVAARMEQVLTTDSAALREKEAAIKQLRAKVEEHGKQPIIAAVAYTWFNRLCALRYMDVNHYTRVGVVSPVGGFTQPEILQQAKQGLFDPDWQLDRKRVTGLLNGSVPSPDGDQEAYRLLLVAACNSYNRQMDFLFTAIQDEAELLMPEDLLSNQSVLQAVRDTLTPEVCQDVEVIGWLYQFYISEKKDQVMAAKGAVKKEDIPAVTQLFTPDWIVRYMVQNSLGRLWLLNYPDSNIRGQMEYYVQPADPETDFLRISSPEELKLLDPACGSGHILTYAFDLLVAIYEEQGYDPVRIPRLILEKNLYGIEIDKRAAMLSSFALMMKARSKDKRFFSRGVKPNILEMEDVSFDPQEVKAYLDRVGQDLYTQNLWEGLQQFENASTYGSLIRPAIKDVPTLRERMQATGVFGDLFLSKTNEKLLQVLEMSEYLSPRYHVVVANPPYLSRKGMNGQVADFMGKEYSSYKSDLFAAFIVRCSELGVNNAFIGMMSPNVWMYISSHQNLRNYLLDHKTLTSLIELPLTGFKGATVQICTFTFSNKVEKSAKGSYVRLVDFKGGDEEMAKLTQSAIANPDCGWFFRVSAADFKKVPGAPISYWASDNALGLFSNNLLGDMANVRQGLRTTDQAKFRRFWFEISFSKINFDVPINKDERLGTIKWVPLVKGGEFRKWHGNNDYVVNWEHDGREIKNSVTKKYPYLHGNTDFVVKNQEYYFRSGITYSALSSRYFSCRRMDHSIFGDGGDAIFSDISYHFLLALLNSKLIKHLLKIINPTLNFLLADIKRIPVVYDKRKAQDLEVVAAELLELSEKDWKAYETTWEFTNSALVPNYRTGTDIFFCEQIKDARNNSRGLTDQFKQLEESSNRIINTTYGMHNELNPEVPLEEITLTCNPHYRYRGDLSDEEREARLLQDTMKEFLSYAVGCMFGRYSLDKPGLILANQGETLQDYLRIIGMQPSFTPTATNVIPILDGEWFTDDIVARFKHFLKLTFGEPNYEENLRFIEGALGKDLRAYFVRDFYKDHVQTYKKRPIYWLFSSPKGSFNALIYMHRYQPDTVSVVLNSYLREYREKLDAQRRYLDNVSTSQSSSAREKTAALKESENLARMQAELKSYEDDVLFPLAGKRIGIDLDDGVVVNYAKFGEALRKI